jgi:hypothetical protein
VIGAQFDTYLEPLMEDLKLLWEVGVHVRNATAFNGQTHFNMSVILMWTMHDLPAYGTIARCATKGYQGCPCCGPNTTTRRLHVLHKNVYCSQHKKWLPMDHPHRHDTSSFEGIWEEGEAPRRMTTNEIYNVVVARMTWLISGDQPQHNDVTKTSGMKRLSILFQLEYWKVNFHIFIHVHPNLKIDRTSPLLEWCYVNH